jgi:hypothetical protein
VNLGVLFIYEPLAWTAASYRRDGVLPARVDGVTQNESVVVMSE